MNMPRCIQPGGSTLGGRSGGSDATLERQATASPQWSSQSETLARTHKGDGAARRRALPTTLVGSAGGECVVTPAGCDGRRGRRVAIGWLPLRQSRELPQLVGGLRAPEACRARAGQQEQGLRYRAISPGKLARNRDTLASGGDP
jgi:hypothetical protein